MTLSDFAARLFPGAPLGQRLPEKVFWTGGRGTAPRAWEGRRREVRAAQRAILWVPSLRSTRTSEWTFWTFLGLFRCVSLLESGPFRGPCWVVAARACLVPSARRGGRLLPRGGACAGAGRRALGYFCWCHFLVGTLERLSERLCRGGCRGACAARRGAAYPFGAGG